jgi:hypothetical protein
MSDREIPNRNKRDNKHSQLYQVIIELKLNSDRTESNINVNINVNINIYVCIKETHPLWTLGRKHGRGMGKDLFPLVVPRFVHVATLKAKDE